MTTFQTTAQQVRKPTDIGRNNVLHWAGVTRASEYNRTIIRHLTEAARDAGLTRAETGDVIHSAIVAAAEVSK